MNDPLFMPITINSLELKNRNMPAMHLIRPTVLEEMRISHTVIGDAGRIGMALMPYIRDSEQESLFNLNVTPLEEEK